MKDHYALSGPKSEDSELRRPLNILQREQRGGGWQEAEIDCS